MSRIKYFQHKKIVIATSALVLTSVIGYAFTFTLSKNSSADSLKQIANGVAQNTKGKIKPDVVSPSPVSGIYEIRVGSELSYVDSTGRYLFIDNHLIDISNPDAPRDLTNEHLAELKKVSIDTLPLDKAIKTVIGTGKRRLVIFEDPHCPHCHALRKAMTDLTDVTIYSFPVSFQRNDGFQLIESSYCSDNPSQNWLNVMTQAALLPIKAGCGAPLQDINDLANKLNINGTPTIFLDSGERIDGFVPLNEWQHKI